MLAILLALVATLVWASSASAAVTQKQAAARAIDAFGSEDGNAAVIVFGLPKPVKAGTSITQAGTPKPTTGGTGGLSSRLRSAGVRTVRAPRVLTARTRSYLFYEDRGPFQLYQHPGRVALVDVETGRITLSKTITWPPLVNNRLPAFLKNAAGYRSSKYQVFNQPYSVPAAQQQPRSSNRNLFDQDPFGPGRPLPSMANSKTIANRLAAERSCVLRVTDTLPTFWNANELNLTRSYVGTLFEKLERDNPDFIDDRYGARSGETLDESVDRLTKAGCKDILLYIAGQGYSSSGEPVIQLGTSVRKGGLIAQQNVSADDLRDLVSSRPGVTFKFKIDAPYAGGMIDRLRDLQNVLLIETAAAPGDEAFAFIPYVQNGGGQMVTDGSNPAGLLDFTNCELIGLKAFFDSAQEIDKAQQAQNEGVSFLVEMLARSQELCKSSGASFADDLGSGPQLYALKRGSGKGTNLPPKADEQTVAATEDTPKSITLTASDPDGDPLTFSITKQPDHGTLSGSGANVTYTPNADYIGPDDFSFKVDDDNGASSNTAKVSINVAEGNDAPVLTTSSGNTTFTEDGGADNIDGGLTVSDVDDTQFERATVRVRASDFQTGDTLVFVDQSGIIGSYGTGTGTGVLTLVGTASESDYQAALRSVRFDTTNQNPDTSKAIDFTVNDGDADSAVGTKNIAVTGVDDAPTANDDSATRTEDAAAAAVPVLGNDTDHENDPITIASATDPANGTVVLTGGSAGAHTGLTYQPDPNYCSTTPDTFTYTVNGGDTATVSITVSCVNDPPDAVNDAPGSFNEDSAQTFPVLSNDTDVENDAIEITDVSNPPNGTASIVQGSPDQISYTPDPNYCGSDSFTYTVNGGDTATVSVTITCVGDNPTANDDAATRAEDSSAAAVPVLSNDTDPDAGDTPTIASATDPANGTVVLTGGSAGAHTGLTYQPDPNYCNTQSGGTPDTFTYTVNGGDSATVSMTVTCVNDATDAVNDAPAAFNEDPASAVTIDVRANDTDADTSFGGSKELVTAKTNGSKGTVDITNGGADVSYTPNANSCGGDTFTYTLAGGDSATVSVTVTCVDDAPVAVDDTHSPAIAEDTTTPTAIDVLANDTDVDAGPKTIDSKTNGLNGATVTITGGGTGIEYTPATNFCGTDTFTYTLSPGSDSATVSVPVTCANDRPVADLNGVDAGINETATFSEPVTDGAGNPTAIAPDAEALDVDDANLDSARITLTNRPDGDSFESLSATASGPISVSAYNSATGVLELTTPSGEATKSEWNTVLRSVRYDNTAASPTSTSRTITVTLNDGELDSDPASTVTLSVVPQNLKPTLDLNGAAAGEDSGATFTEGDSPVSLAPAAEAADADDPDLASATIALTNQSDGSAESITVDTALAASLGVTVSNNGTHTVGLSGGQPVDDYEQVLRTAKYANTSQNPGTASRSITFVINDGQDNSDTRTSTVTMTAVNDPPVNTVNASAIAMNEDATYVIAAGDLSFADPDATTLEITMTATNGTMSITDTTGLTPTGGTTDVATLNFTGSPATINSKIAAGHFTFKPTANYNGNGASIQVTSDDNGQTPAPELTDTDSLTFNVAPVNDPVSITPVPNTLTVNEDTEGTFSPSPQIADADNGNVEVTLTATKGDITLGGTAGLTITAGANGSETMTFNGSLSAVNTALTGLKYQGNQDEDTDDQLSISVNDGTGAGSTTDSENVTIDIVPVNDAPNGVDDTFNGPNSAIGNTTLIVDADNDNAPSVSHPHKAIDGNVLANDTDIDGPTPRTVKPEDKLTANDGRVIIEADGDFTFHPEPGASCTDDTDSFTYTVRDAFSPTQGEDQTPATVTINLEACVWYVNNNFSGTPDNEGTARAPFNTLEQGESNSLAGHTVFVLDSGTKYQASASYTMNSNERLLGEHEGLVVDPDGTGSDYGADQLRAGNTGAYPILTSVSVSDDVIDLAGGVEVRGFDVDPALSGGGICGGVACGGQASNGSTIDDVNVNDTVASGVEMGAQPGLELNATTGTHTVTDFTYANPTAYAAPGVLLTNAGHVEFGTGDAGDPTKINKNGGPALVSTGTRLGNSTFDEITVASSGTGGVNVSGATGANDVTFGDGNGNDLVLTTTSGPDPAFRLDGNAGSWTVPAGGTANVSATGGPAVDIVGTSGGGYSFDDVDSTNSSTAGGASGDGVNLDGLGATNFTATSGDIRGAAGVGFDLNGGSAGVSYPGDIGDPNAATPNDGDSTWSVEVTGRTAGTATFSGEIFDDDDAAGGIHVTGNTGGTTEFTNNEAGPNKVLNTGGSRAVDFDTNGDGHRLEFTGGGLDIDTTAGDGLAASNSGILRVSGSGNTIDTGSGRGLNISDTGIAADKVTFQGISTNGAPTGIRLNNTGTDGNLAVTGNGGTCTNADTSGCSGGVIQNGTGGDNATATPDGTGVMLNNTDDVSLTRMHIQNHSNYGIRGTDVDGFSLQNSVINGVNGTNSGGGFDDSSVYFDNNSGPALTGSAVISNSHVSGGFTNNVWVSQTSGSLNRLTMDALTVGHNSTTNGNQGLMVEGLGSSTTNVTLQNSTLTGSRGMVSQFIGNGTGGGDLDVHNTDFTNTHPAADSASGMLGINGGAGSGGTFNVDISSAGLGNNTFIGSRGAAVNIIKSNGSGNLTGTFDGNAIGAQTGTGGTATNGSSGSVNGSGLRYQHAGGGGTGTLNITNNTIREYNNNGMTIQASAGGVADSGTMNANITGNTVTDPGGNASVVGFYGLSLQAGVIANDNFTLCAHVKDNDVIDSETDPVDNPQTDMFAWARFNSTIRLPGYAGGPTDTAAVANFLKNQNDANPNSPAQENPAPTASALASNSGTFTGSGSSCP